MAFSSDNARTRSVTDAGNAGGGEPAGALCWAKRWRAREAGALERTGTQHTLSTHQTTTPLLHQSLCRLQLLWASSHQHRMRPLCSPLSGALKVFMVVRCTLTSTVIHGRGDLHKVITLDVSHHRIHHPIALPHSHRTARDRPHMHGSLPVRVSVILARQ
jgi:hypothetical protein